MPDPNPQTALESELAELIVTTLALEVAPSSIVPSAPLYGKGLDLDPTAPLYGKGLDLDSIDILEVALAVSKAFGVKLRADDKNNEAIFSSLRSLSEYIQQRRRT